MTRRRWRLRASLAGVLTLSVLASVGTPGAAAPPTDPPTTPAAAGDPTSGGTSGQPLTNTTVTLITGDVVAVGVTGDRKLTATVAAVARRADGSQPTFLQVTAGDAHYVYPSDAVSLVEAGKLDPRLFDVSYLAGNGYADAQTTSLPLIVQYHRPSQAAQDAGRGVRDLAASVDALPGTSTPRALYGINAAATNVDRKQVTQLWTTLTGGARPAATRAIDQGMSKIWLDAKVTVDLDASVPQIGAPAAWEAGYTGAGVKVAVLDTGVDLNHPDLASRIVGSQSFVPGQEVQDGHGHGTHVAATIAGSGAASGGKYQGVAPGADLLVGKVLNNNGSSLFSWAIAGMEWAAANGADIVSMSFGGRDAPGIDPLEQAVSDLTDQYGTLFVIAAGNNGGTERTIDTPGSAADALTVAAVDKQDALASFSSRGPTIDFVSKPDIAAPGVDIVAARAAGTRMGTPVDDLHTKASGTSMATPHVAGAAAILAQQHPDWTGPQLKAVLTATAVDTPATPLQEGAGRVDVARAVTATVLGDGRIDFGQVSYPHDKPVTRTLTYTNGGDTAVTLHLAASFDSRVGPAPEGTLTVDKSTVEVPAGGSATVTVTLDFAGAGSDTWYSGVITATGTSGVSLRTAVGAFKSPKRGRITVDTISGPHMPGMTFNAFGVLRVDDRRDLDTTYVFNGAAEASVDVLAGKFSVLGSVSWEDADGTWNLLPVSAPEFTVDGDTTVTLDLRKATPLKVRTPKPTDEYRLRGGIHRRAASGTSLAVDADLPYRGRLWSLPTSKAATGKFFAYSQHLLGAPPISMAAKGLTLNPRYLGVDPTNGMLDGTHRLTVVSGGTGTAADLSEVDADGRLVLLDLSDVCPTAACDSAAQERVANAHQAGAAAVLFHGVTTRPQMAWSANAEHARIPLMNLPPTEARALAAAVARGPVTVTAKGVADSPYLYSLKFYQRQQVPARPDLTVDRKNLAEVHSSLHMDTPGYYRSFWGAFLDGTDDPSSSRLDLFTASQRTRTEYIGPVAEDVAWLRQNNPYQMTFHPRQVETGTPQLAVRRYTAPGRYTEQWGLQPFTPGTRNVSPQQVLPGMEQCAGCRLGDRLNPGHLLSDGDGITSAQVLQFNNEGRSVSGDLRLFRGDEEIPMEPYGAYLGLFIAWFPTFPVPAEPATYRMVSTYRSVDDLTRYARDIDTEWTFRSQRPAPGDKSGTCGLAIFYADLGPCYAQRKLFLDYDVDLALDNTAKAGAPQTITVSGYGDSFTDPGAKLTSLTTDVSYDSGATWKKVPAVKINGSYRVFLWHPALNRTDGTVSLRTSATDSYGNTIKQTIKQAYGLR